MADQQQGTFAVKAGLAQMLKGGVIMDVTNVEEARIAEEAGAVAVMALERVPADIRRCDTGNTVVILRVLCSRAVPCEARLRHRSVSFRLRLRLASPARRRV